LALGPIHPPIQWVSEALFPVKSGWSVKLTTDHHLVPRLRMIRAAALLSYMPSWHVLGHQYFTLAPNLEFSGNKRNWSWIMKLKQPLILTSGEVQIVGSSPICFPQRFTSHWQHFLLPLAQKYL